MDGKLFPEVPDDLSKLSKDELETLRADSLAAIDKINAEDAEFLGDRTASQVIDELTAGVEQIERIKDQLTVLAEAESAYEAKKAELKARAEAAAPAPEAEETADEPEAEVENADAGEPETLEVVAEDENVEPEADAAVERELELVASAEKPLRRPPRATGKHRPLQDKPSGAVMVASADLRGVSAGAELDERGLAEAMAAAARLDISAPEGFRQNAVIASVRFPFPEERILDKNDTGDRNAEKIKAVAGRQALVASGGLCAPVTPIYDIPIISVADRPVRDALPSFQAVRGGVNLPAPITIGDVTTGVGYITEAQDAAGGSPATKACQTVSCPSYTATYVNAIYHCMKFGNLGARAWPELISSFNEELMAAFARLADTKLLDNIATGSTHVTGAQVNGAVNTLLGHILQAAAGIRSYHRMRDGAVLRALFPAWVKDLLVLDIVRSQFERFAYSRDGIQQLLAMFDIQASFFLDGETGASQVFGSQGAAALNAFPGTLIWYLFPEGTWLHLDSGSLELGIVRDSSLNATNDFENFGETWENVAKVGAVSYRVASTVCASGAVTAPGSAVACGATA